jgi:hypothetical protein
MTDIRQSVASAGTLSASGSGSGGRPSAPALQQSYQAGYQAGYNNGYDAAKDLFQNPDDPKHITIKTPRDGKSVITSFCDFMCYPDHVARYR